MHRLSQDLRVEIIKKIITKVKNNIAVIIKDNYTLCDVRPKGKYFTLKELQDAVGGYIEAYPVLIVKDCELYCDEEGLLKERKYNQLAYDLYRIDIVGDAIIVPISLLDTGEDEDES